MKQPFVGILVRLILALTQCHLAGSISVAGVSITITCPNDKNTVLEEMTFCGQSVLDYVQEKCALQTVNSPCSVSAADIRGALSIPGCDSDVIRGEYACQEQITCTSCDGPQEIVVEQNVQYVVSSDSPCGSPTCPLRFITEAGLGFTVNVIDQLLSAATRGQISQEDLTTEQLSDCSFTVDMGVPDGTATRRLCGGYERLLQETMLSNTQVMDLTFLTQNESALYDILIEVNGCQIPVAPDHGWMVGVNDSVTAFGCLYSDITWIQTCIRTELEGISAVCADMDCPDRSQIRGDIFTECRAEEAATYRDGAKIGCCETSREITYCPDGAVPTSTVYGGCPAGFIANRVGGETNCCPLFPQRPQCPDNMYTIPLDGNDCPSGAVQVIMQAQDRFWVGCCRSLPDKLCNTLRDVTDGGGLPIIGQAEIVTDAVSRADCPNLGPLTRTGFVACGENEVIALRENERIGCCSQAPLNLCMDGSVSIDFISETCCPYGYIPETIKDQTRCCPLFTKNPECPTGYYSVAMEQGQVCPTDAVMVYLKRGDNFWVGCCMDNQFRECPQSCMQIAGHTESTRITDLLLHGFVVIITYVLAKYF